MPSIVHPPLGSSSEYHITLLLSHGVVAGECYLVLVLGPCVEYSILPPVFDRRCHTGSAKTGTGHSNPKSCFVVHVHAGSAAIRVNNWKLIVGRADCAGNAPNSTNGTIGKCPSGWVHPSGVMVSVTIGMKILP